MKFYLVLLALLPQSLWATCMRTTVTCTSESEEATFTLNHVRCAAPRGPVHSSFSISKLNKGQAKYSGSVYLSSPTRDAEGGTVYQFKNESGDYAYFRQEGKSAMVEISFPSNSAFSTDGVVDDLVCGGERPH